MRTRRVKKRYLNKAARLPAWRLCFFGNERAARRNAQRLTAEGDRFVGALQMAAEFLVRHLAQQGFLFWRPPANRAAKSRNAKEMPLSERGPSGAPHAFGHHRVGHRSEKLLFLRGPRTMFVARLKNSQGKTTCIDRPTIASQLACGFFIRRGSEQFLLFWRPRLDAWKAWDAQFPAVILNNLTGPFQQSSKFFIRQCSEKLFLFGSPPPDWRLRIQRGDAKLLALPCNNAASALEPGGCFAVREVAQQSIFLR